MSIQSFITSADPELLRQALELVLGRVDPNHPWWISTSAGQASINSPLEQDTLQSIVTFIESTPDFVAENYVYDNTNGFTENVALLKAKALAQIDVEAGKARLKYLTSIPGQDATYLAKEADCRAYRTAGYPTDLTSFEWVAAEAEATGNTSVVAADAIILQADQWRVVGSAIEKVRRSGKIDIGKKLKGSTIKASLASTIQALQTL